LAKGENLLLLVDQFEELFRYQDYAGREQQASDKGQPVSLIGSNDGKYYGPDSIEYFRSAPDIANEHWGRFTPAGFKRKRGRLRFGGLCDEVIRELATSTRLPVPAAIAFALFAQLVLVETSLPQFAAHIPPSWSLAGLPVCAAISFAPLPQPVFVFAGTPQFLALPTPSAAAIVDTDASGSNLNRLGKGRHRNKKKNHCRRDGECKFARSLEHYYSSHLNAGESRLCRMLARSDSFLTFMSQQAHTIDS
jgi:hypothetical protein